MSYITFAQGLAFTIITKTCTVLRVDVLPFFLKKKKRKRHGSYFSKQIDRAMLLARWNGFWASLKEKAAKEAAELPRVRTRLRNKTTLAMYKGPVADALSPAREIKTELGVE